MKCFLLHMKSLLKYVLSYLGFKVKLKLTTCAGGCLSCFRDAGFSRGAADVLVWLIHLSRKTSASGHNGWC